MRRRRSSTALPETWRSIAAQRLRQWQQLFDNERTQLEQRAGVLLAKRWEAAHGFALTDEMRVTVALNAALLYLGRDEQPFTNVTSVVIHPTTAILRGERSGPSPGVVTDAPLATLGHTSARGPVFIAWDAVMRESATPQRTTNVILHEFAHKIDALDGTFDGTPRLAGDELAEWVRVCTAEMHALRRGHASAALRPYAATNPSEFFAVATEVFFEHPVLLRTEKPELYAVLSGFYRQDLAGRATPAPSTSTSTNTGWP